ncbi:hypothetical protein GCM10027347_59320 [Larkinella harenae]
MKKRPPHPLLTPDDIARLTENGQNRTIIHTPVCRLFTTLGYNHRGKEMHNGQWLLTEINPNKPHMAYGLYDDGKGNVYMDDINLDELALLRFLKDRCPLVERDPEFIGQYPITIYEEAALRAGKIVTDADRLVRAAYSRDERLILNSLRGMQFV